MVRRRWNSILNNLKDYIVPIVWLILVIVLIYSFFGGGETKPSTNTENKIWLNISLDSSTSKGKITFSGWKEKEVDADLKLYKWDKLTIENWNMSISDNDLSIKLKKLWEIKYLEDGSFKLFSWKAWINTEKAIKIGMKYANLAIQKNAHISLSQNEVSSTIYVISWVVEVSNLKWKSTVLSAKQRLEIGMIDASNEEIDLKTKIEPLDDTFLKGEWFILNNWDTFMTEISTWKIDEKWDSEKKSVSKKFSAKNNILFFDNLSDEVNVSSSSINIAWNYTDESIAKIIVNWKLAKLNKDKKTFEFDKIDVWAKENNLVFKVYDDANDLLSKFVYTVYFDWGTSTNTNTWWWAFKVDTFNVDGTQFTFTAPSSNPTFTTYGDHVEIRWKVLAKWIDRVSVNDFTLNSFNWTTWRYHAMTSFNNLADWTNRYEIKYYKDGKLVYTNYYTIIKKTWVIKTKTDKKVEEEKTWSWETEK